MPERLHKVLAQHGLGSRREIERWMLEGRVRLNHTPAQAGAQFSPGDRVAIDGVDVTARLRETGAAQVLMYHKPQHQPVTPGPDARKEAADDDGGESVMERLPAKRGVRWLVINTMQVADSGLLLLTTDGRLADALRRRADTIRAAYVARVLVPPDFDVTGFPLDVRYDEATITFSGVEAAGGEGANRWFRVESDHSHRRAAVRALFESRGLGVSRVTQVGYAMLELPRDLPRGKHRELTDTQVRALYSLAGIEPAPAAGRDAPGRTSSSRGRNPRGDASNSAPSSKTSGKSKPARISADRAGGRSGRRPGGKSPTRQRTKPGAIGSRKSDR